MRQIIPRSVNRSGPLSDPQVHYKTRHQAQRSLFMEVKMSATDVIVCAAVLQFLQSQNQLNVH